MYFDTAAFSANKEHFYAKLVPEAYGDIDPEQLLKNMREGEGELSLEGQVRSLPSHSFNLHSYS